MTLYTNENCYYHSINNEQLNAAVGLDAQCFVMMMMMMYFVCEG